MKYSVIKQCDIANGPGVRVSLFVSGCRNHCPGCFQPETWDFNYGKEFTADVGEEIIEYLDKPYIQGLTILGGDPMEPENAAALWGFVCAVKHRLPKKDIWIYSGYTMDQFLILRDSKPQDCRVMLLNYADVLIDGRFIQEQKDISLRFRGSKNQRILDIHKSFYYDKPIAWTDPHAMKTDIKKEK